MGRHRIYRSSDLHRQDDVRLTENEGTQARSESHMKKEDLLKAFAEMSPGDQDAIRAELIGKQASDKPRDPIAVCWETMWKMKERCR